MMIERREVEYHVGDLRCVGLAVWDDAQPSARPGVLVSPTIKGRTAFEEGKAEDLARLGYVGFALDIYGAEHRPADMASARPLMDALNADRRELQRRLVAAHGTLKGLPEVDSAKTAAIGFCFGGKCVLDLARTGSDVLGVAPFHGLFDAPPFRAADRISAKVLAAHGWDDPLVKPEAVVALAAELTELGADWQIHAYGHTVHGFTNPASAEMYNADADRRSWKALVDFLAEIFA